MQENSRSWDGRRRRPWGGDVVYLFARGTRLGPGSAHEETAWAVAITEKVNQISETKVSLWTTFMSPGVNTLFWTTFVEDLSVLEATNDKLLADSGYHMLLEQGARYASTDPIDDILMQVVHADGIDVNKQPAYIVEVAAVLASGSGAKGIEIGVEIAQRAAKITGAPVSFSIGATGVYGAVAWHTAFDSITELQRGQTAIAMDPTFMQFLDTTAAGVYQPSATQNIYRRLM
jgi:hypothetical protein